MVDDRRIIHEITPLMGKDVLYIAAVSYTHLHLLSIPVKFAIYARASVAFTQMMTAKIRKSLGFFSPSHVDLSNQVLFDADEMSYEEMLHQLCLLYTSTTQMVEASRRESEQIGQTSVSLIL